MYENSGSQFFRTATRIQSRPDAFDESRFVMTFLTILGVMQFQISSRRESRQRDTCAIENRVLRKVFSKQFWFIRCRRQHLWAIEQVRYNRFTFVENTISNSPKVPRAKFLESDALFCFSSICKFGIFKNPSVMITSLSELYFRFSKIYSAGANGKGDFYDLWQQHKLLKTMKMSEA